MATFSSSKRVAFQLVEGERKQAAMRIFFVSLLSLASSCSAVHYSLEDPLLTGMAEAERPLRESEDLPFPLELPLRTEPLAWLSPKSRYLIAERVETMLEDLLSGRSMSIKTPVRASEVPAGVSHAGVFFPYFIAECRRKGRTLGNTEKIARLNALQRDYRRVTGLLRSLQRSPEDSTLLQINSDISFMDSYTQKQFLSAGELEGITKSLLVLQEAAMYSLGKSFGFADYTEQRWEAARQGNWRGAASSLFLTQMEAITAAHARSSSSSAARFPAPFSMGSFTLEGSETRVQVEPTFSMLQLEEAIRLLDGFSVLSRRDHVGFARNRLIYRRIRLETPLSAVLLLARSLWFPEALKADEREVMEVIRRHDWQQQALSVALLEARNLFRLATSLAGEAGADQGRGEEVSALSRSSEAVSVQSRGPLMSVLEVLGQQAQAQGAAPSFASPEQKRRAEGLIMKRALQVYFRSLSPEEQAHVLSSIKRILKRSRLSKLWSSGRSLFSSTKTSGSSKSGSHGASSTLSGMFSCVSSSGQKKGKSEWRGPMPTIRDESSDSSDGEEERKGTEFSLSRCTRAFALSPAGRELFRALYRFLKPSRAAGLKAAVLRALPSLPSRPPRSLLAGKTSSIVESFVGISRG